MAYIRWFETLSKNDVPLVGGKNASLGEMVSSLQQEGIKVPNGFATTAQAYFDFIEQNQLRKKLHISCLPPLLSQRKENISALFLSQVIFLLSLNKSWLLPIKNSARIATSQCAVVQQRKTCRMLASPDSKRPSCICVGSKPF